MSRFAGVEMHVVDPRAMSKSDFLGRLDPVTGEWRDGVLPSLMRRFAEERADGEARFQLAAKKATAAAGGGGSASKRGNKGKGKGKGGNSLSYGDTLRDALRLARLSAGEKEHWIIMDGPIDPEWAESLNSLLDDNRLLSLPSGERLQLPEGVSLVFETDSLESATPATVSRCGMVWVSEGFIPLARRVAAELAEALRG